jgi:hypothetical protein
MQNGGGCGYPVLYLDHHCGMLLLTAPRRTRAVWILRRYSSSSRQERIFTLPNTLTVGRIVACPFLGYSILHGNFAVATGILVAGGFTDWVCAPPRVR